MSLGTRARKSGPVGYWVNEKSYSARKTYPRCTVRGPLSQPSEKPRPRVENLSPSANGPVMRIAIASHHNGIQLKADLPEWLIQEGPEVAHFGPDPGQSVA